METSFSLRELAAMIGGPNTLTESEVIEKIGQIYKNATDSAEKKESERILVGLLQDKRISDKTNILFYLMIREPIESHKSIIKEYLWKHNKLAQTIQNLIIERDELPWLTR